jgi:hypothetical protein
MQIEFVRYVSGTCFLKPSWIIRMIGGGMRVRLDGTVASGGPKEWEGLPGEGRGRGIEEGAEEDGPIRGKR